MLKVQRRAAERDGMTTTIQGTTPAQPVSEDLVIAALCSVGAALINGDLQLARVAVEQIAVQIAAPSPRRPLPIAVIARVFQRDRFVCRYCSKRTIPTAVLRAISSVPSLQDAFPYHRAKRADSTHPAYRSHGATCDHIVPIAGGGSRDNPTNLATACWECNRTKGDRPIDETTLSLQPITIDDAWDGMTGSYRTIWQAAGRPDLAFHRAWMKAFAL